MLKDLVELLQQDSVQPYYIGLCMAMMVLPMLGACDLVSPPDRRQRGWPAADARKR